MELKNIDSLLKSKDKINGLMDKGLLGHVDKNLLNSSILTLEKLRKQYDSADANGKIKMLGFMDKEYKNIVSNIPNLKNKVLVNKQLAEESGDKKLLNEYDKTFKDIDVLDKNINKDKKEEPSDIEGIGLADESKIEKQVVVPNTQPNNVGVQPLTYQDRKIIKNIETGKWEYESKDPSKGKKVFDTEEAAKADIESGIKGFYKAGLKQANTTGDKVGAEDLTKRAKKRNITADEINAWLSE